MNKTRITLFIAMFSFIASSSSFAEEIQSVRCQASCGGIPKGQCFCVTTDGIKCCSQRPEGFTSKQNLN
ncbi:MAG: hypothetical protein H0U73_08940 [Tatlockia sp.]|nr:hypothetical protein [Tatlockia sp.]